jgi:hypothetical protein
MADIAFRDRFLAGDREAVAQMKALDTLIAAAKTARGY